VTGTGPFTITFTGSVANPGLIAVANNSLSPSGSTITPSGNPVVVNDKLNLTGALTLGGTSSLTLDLNGLTTSTGGSITIVTDGSRTGTFPSANISLINNPLGLVAAVRYTATTVTVNLEAAPDP